LKIPYRSRPLQRPGYVDQKLASERLCKSAVIHALRKRCRSVVYLWNSLFACRKAQDFAILHWEV
jgi:hypothetical protein